MSRGAIAAALCAVLVASGCASRSGPAPVIERLPPSRGAKAPAAPPPSAAKPAADGTYVVKKGDTLYSIALEHGADYREVAQWNYIDDPSKLSIGQVLRVKPPAPQAGVQVGSARVPGRIESRPLDSPAKPEPKAPEPKAAEPVAAAAAADFIWPAKGKVITAFAEPRSKGIDIDGKLGDPIVAAAAGRVTYIGTGIPGLGKLVVIKHDNGFITVYAHNREILVKEQQAVTRGQKIAELGSSDADRPKLHFQIRRGSSAVDPLKYLPTS